MKYQIARLPKDLAALESILDGLGELFAHPAEDVEREISDHGLELYEFYDKVVTAISTAADRCISDLESLKRDVETIVRVNKNREELQRTFNGMRTGREPERRDA